MEFNWRVTYFNIVKCYRTSRNKKFKLKIKQLNESILSNVGLEKKNFQTMPFKSYFRRFGIILNFISIKFSGFY